VTLVASGLGSLARSITGPGRAVLGVGVVAWFLGYRLGWDELLLVAGGCLVAVAVALVFTLGRASLDIGIELDPHRIVVGEQAVGRVSVTNTSPRRMLPARLEAPVGAGVARFEVPTLAAGASWDELFVVPTTRRSIIPIGPVSSVRGDPLGLARRALAWAEPVDLYVHPKTVRLAGLTSGWIRDLEGRPTNDLSPSDVAFHTLREYVPGDDRRHVHWRTSARLGTLMVRQFVDSRRSHLGLVLSTSSADFASDDEFELAVSTIASLGVSALVEDQAVTVTTGGRPLPAYAAPRLLDGLAGVELTARRADLASLVRHSVPIVRGASVVALVTGSRVAPTALRAAAQIFHHDVRVLAVRTQPGVQAALQTIGSTTVLDLGGLDDLPRVMRATVSR
jgi:uncharacterized protein (DUF58 family)